MSKLETRNSKLEGSAKSEARKLVQHFKRFDFRYSDFLRISDFGLRISLSEAAA